MEEVKEMSGLNQSKRRNAVNYKKPMFWVIIVAMVAVVAVAAGLINKPVGSITYENDKYGFSMILPKDFADKVNVGEEGNFVFFTYKEIQDMHSDGILGVVGRIEIYDKKETTKNQIKELADMYNLKYLGENEKYYFGWAHATDVQIPPNASDQIKENYRALEEEFDQVIKTFKIKNGFKNEIVSVVEDFGSKLQLVPLVAPEDEVAKSIQENYSGLVAPALIEKWTNDPQNAPGRVGSSPWPDRIEILKVDRVSKDEYEVKGNIVEITSVEIINGGAAAKRPVTLVMKKIDGHWLISELTMGQYKRNTSSLGDDDYSLVVGKQTISLNSQDIQQIYKTLGKPISETEEVLGSNADTFTGSRIKTLKYEDIEIKLFSPKDNPSAYWIMLMDVTGSDIQTPRGIAIGSTLEQLKKAYSNLAVVPEDRIDKSTYTYRVGKYEEFKHMEYTVKDGIVTQIRLYIEMP